ncbi:hypothetical protein BJV77DRAFT_732077 [Russula vinacea]|nr:hypothetical protein BJV77DRAFT_732077 [Russula vinacea]
MMTVPYLCSTDPTEELLEALALFGKCDLLAMRMFLFPSHSLKQLGFMSETHRRSQFKICIFVYSYKNRVEKYCVTNGFLSPPGAKPTHRTHQEPPVRPVLWVLGAPPFGKSLDPATSSTILEELKRTVPRWRGTQEPSRVLWIGRLSTPRWLTNLWSRLGCVVEVRTLSNGFVHVEFAYGGGTVHRASGCTTDSVTRSVCRTSILHVRCCHDVRHPQHDREFVRLLSDLYPAYIMSRDNTAAVPGEERSTIRSAFLQFGKRTCARCSVCWMDDR